MVNQRESSEIYQMLTRFSVWVTVCFLMTCTSFQALGNSALWGGCLIPFRTEVPTGPVTGMNDLPGDKGVLMGTWNGLFRFDMASRRVDIAEGVKTGAVHGMYNLPGDSEVLIGAVNGVFLFDMALQRVSMANGEKTVPVIGMHTLPENKGVLISTWSGLFWYDPASRKVVLADGEKTSPAIGMYDLPGRQGILIETWNGLFRFDMRSRKVVMAGIAKTGRVTNTHVLPGDNGILIGAESGLFRFDMALREVVPVSGAKTGLVQGMHDLPGGYGVLIGADNGVFRFDTESLEVVLADGEQTGQVNDTNDLPGGGGVLIGAQNSLFLFDTALRKVVPAHNASTGRVNDTHDLPGGNGVLIGAQDGLFRFDMDLKEVVPVGGANLGPVSETHDLPEGNGLLIEAAKGWFRFDESSQKVVPAGDERAGRVYVIHKLPGSNMVLIGAQKGLYQIPSLPLSNAKVELISKNPLKVLEDVSQEVHLRFSHPCASQSDALGLRLATSPAGESQNINQLLNTHQVKMVETGSGSAEITSSVRFDKAGDWKLQLFQAENAVGEPVPILARGLTFIEYLISIWPQIMFVLGAIYITLFLALLWISHRSLGVLRMLMDPAWGAKLLTWPFFLLRHVPAVQRWVLEPWFQNVRRTLTLPDPDPKPAFLDPPVTDKLPVWGKPLVRDPKGRVINATTLLNELSSRRRVWLQGCTGMGKSAVFMEWAKIYYCDSNKATLADAVRKHGFILIMLPVRDYAMTEPPDSGNPESWVIEAIRQRLGQFGLTIEDASVLQAMLRTGHIAIALDGTNEADRNQAIAAFERQYPEVKIIATSQSDAKTGWDKWYLPKDILEQRAALLKLWLGNEAGRVLELRLMLDRNAAIASGYDLRLVYDLTRSDPSGTPIPEGRIGLYGAVLCKATHSDGEPLDLLPLRQLAVQMIVEERRAIKLGEGLIIGEDIIDILSKDDVRVIRKVGSGWEFRHDQMRAFLAACSLANDTLTLKQLISRIEEGRMFRVRRDDQVTLWGFLADVLNDNELQTLWVYAQSDPGERGLLQGALQRIADQRKIQLLRPIAG